MQSLGRQMIGDLVLNFGHIKEIHHGDLRINTIIVGSRGFSSGVIGLEFYSLLQEVLLAEGATEVCEFASFKNHSVGATLDFDRAAQFDGLVVRQVNEIVSLISNDEPIAKELIEETIHALGSFGFKAEHLIVDWSQLKDRVEALRPRFRDGIRISIAQHRNRLLQEVNGFFVEPAVLEEHDQSSRKSFFQATEQWLTESKDKTLLVLGEYGSGKSTALAEWCYRRSIETDPNRDRNRPDLLLVNLSEMAAGTDPLGMLLQSCGAEDSEPSRAAMQALIQAGRLIPVFDGFDEMATRVTPESLSSQLATLLAVGGQFGRVVVSSRDHYFPREQDLSAAWQQALANSIGQSAGVTTLRLQLFDEQQIRQLVTGVAGNDKTESIVERIVHQYPLEQLAQRPLLLAMVLKTIDSFDERATISRADLYLAYLNRWLEQTDRDDRELFDAPQKMELAKRVAARLWSSGQASLSVDDLSTIVRQELAKELPNDMPVGAALLEIFGGSFFVHEQGDSERQA